jgi:hypothetical protein
VYTFFAPLYVRPKHSTLFNVSSEIYTYAQNVIYCNETNVWMKSLNSSVSKATRLRFELQRT